MSQRSQILLNPRKSPIQARSTASVDALLEATIQVLLKVGKERLTTTRVALRAGVSVGTLYQYFPNKSALLQAVLKRHLNEVTEAVENACQQQKSKPLPQMGAAIIDAFLQAKVRNVEISAALYAISSDVGGAKIVQQMNVRSNKAIVEVLKTACKPLTRDPQLMAFLLQGAMTGISRGLLESEAPEIQLAALRQELIFLVNTYLEACSGQ